MTIKKAIAHSQFYILNSTFTPSPFAFYIALRAIIIIFCSLLTTSFPLTQPVFADETIENDLIVNAGSVDGVVEMRSGPGSEYDLVEQVSDGTIVSFCSQCIPEEVIQVDSEGCQLYKVSLPETSIDGFIRGDFLYQRYAGIVSDTCSTSN